LYLFSIYLCALLLITNLYLIMYFIEENEITTAPTSTTEVSAPVVNPMKPLASKIVSIKPRTDVDRIRVGMECANAWEASGLELLWLTVADFRILLDKYSSTQLTKVGVSGKRTSRSADLSKLIRELQASIEHVKNHIFRITGNRKDSYSRFGEFGINNTPGKPYKLPTDTDQFRVALDAVISGLQTYNIQDDLYGIDYWTTQRDLYNDLYSQITSSTGEVTLAVGDKSVLRNEVDEAFDAILSLIKANYPKTWENVARNWGFQKERY